MEYSTNLKFSKALKAIEADLLELGLDEIKRYYNDFKREVDYNIAQYGNLLIYYSDIYDFYRSYGYKSVDKMNTDKVWDFYKRQVGYVARCLINAN